jgi:hypothetical protein
MNNIDRDILQALQVKARAAYTATTALSGQTGWTEATRIKTVGRTLMPPTDGKYLEFVHIPNNQGGDQWDESQDYAGGFRIILHWPLTDNEGPYPAMDLMDALAGQFQKGQPIQVSAGLMLTFDKNPGASGPIENGSELLFPVTLSYRCFKPS